MEGIKNEGYSYGYGQNQVVDEVPKWTSEAAKKINRHSQEIIKATLFWKGKPIWKGNYWELNNKLIKLDKEPEIEAEPEIINPPSPENDEIC
ncbi:MAG: hypothetical protein I3273_06980 [Candidatus Moeniiplasma glomeromycotorum]|nr:hypothetical protein [Candidatus Moeniiplasma glomeromycotorum]MCE8168261.1 hypothetical protein [Candidatus Moeniiplasma glomeromycotorum]MCE8169830.1 hypothetical protein [Candidatus Moeniiplasma glomeromycotorum]